MVTIATWNVNSIRARLPNVTAWLRQMNPDIVCLQEIKTVNDGFPRAAIEDLGYNVAIHGQKTYNGVALLSKFPIEDVQAGLPGDDEDDHARYLEGVIAINGTVVRVASIYLPNGNPCPGEKYDYKLSWMDRLIAHTRTLLAFEEPFALAGDYNVIPTPQDVHDPDAWEEDALFRLETREKFRTLINLGLTDSFRALNSAAENYTFWDYQAGAWPKNNGIRIDHLLLSPQATDLLQTCTIERHVRDWEKPSDHVPIYIELAI